VSATAWGVALESIDRELEALEAALAAGDDEGLALEALPVAAREALGPLPVDLLERAAEVQARMSRLEQAMAFSLQRAKGSHAFAADRFASGRELPRFLDRRG
jgi:hypothetical protein